MRIKKVGRDCIISISVTDKEKMAIVVAAKREGRTVSSYIRYRLQDILEGVNDDRT